MMSRIRAFSSPSVLPPSSSTSHIEVPPEDHSLEGNLYNAGVMSHDNNFRIAFEHVYI